jgi:coenzyme F420 hydrogenase subunit beta
MIEMWYREKSGIFYPKIFVSDRDKEIRQALDLCPGKGYPIIKLSRVFEGGNCSRSMELGTWRSAWAAHSTSSEILEYASSGGVMTAIAHFLIAEKEIDGVVVTGMEYGSHGPRPKAFIARNLQELCSAQGSKYCPSPSLLAISDATSAKGRFAFIGTPCQIAALRMMQERSQRLREKFPFVLGSFCGGFRDLRETDALIKREGFAPGDVVEFRYRGGGQPGSMIIRDKKGITAERPYPQYSRRTGFVKHRRCRMCIDATAELADFSCGDAWLPRFLKSEEPWSIVMARSLKAAEIIKVMRQRNLLATGDISEDEIKKSQYDNLNSKKTRQAARRRLYSALGFVVPEFDGGFPQGENGLGFELRVLMAHLTLNTIEQLGLYPIVGKLTGRY